MSLFARIGTVLSGLVCVIVTPPFALAYVAAYGSDSGESAPQWIESLDWLGFLAGGDVAVYDAYGVIFGFALLVMTGLFAYLVAQRRGKGDWEQLGWRVTLAGLFAVAIGSLAEYGIPEGILDASWGFGLELLGLIALIIGMAILGYASRIEAGVSRAKAILIGTSGLLGVVVGSALVGHLPSGPATPFVVGSVVLAIAGLGSSQPESSATV